MQRLEVSGAVRPLYRSLDFKGLIVEVILRNARCNSKVIVLHKLNSVGQFSCNSQNVFVFFCFVLFWTASRHCHHSQFLTLSLP